MPNITFILPHWIYWGGLIAVPAFFMWATRYYKDQGTKASGASIWLAYFYLLIAGFMGIHRLYLKSWWATLFIALFVGIVLCNYEAKLTRNAHSIAKNEAFNASYDLNAAFDEGEDDDVLKKLEGDVEVATAREERLAMELENWHKASGGIGLVILLLLLMDAVLLPKMVRRKEQTEKEQDQQADVADWSEAIETVAIPTGSNAFVRAAGRINGFAGEFAAYWTVIAVFVFYYEVLARYIFNSPTIWAHESMFLMFGIQYLLAGGFCLRENAHVRVDVFYMHLSDRGKAIVDLITSVVFLIFVLSLLVTGWIFFHDSFSILQVSHTEWEIAHWPVKFALPLGGALLLLQGMARIVEDIALLAGKDVVKGS